MNKDVVRLLDRLYKDLYKSDEVIHHGSGNVYDKFNNIESYISDLENMHKRVTETGRHKDYLKKLYYDKYVIKKEDIPASYYYHQKEIALERGYGHVEVDRKQIQEDIINNQKRSLDTWLDYFLSEDSSIYPFWAKYWAFQGMLKLGTYDKEKGTFNKRTKDTIEPFCDLNREALAMSIDMLIKMLNKEKFDDNELEALVKTGSFQKIYTYILNNVLKDNKNITKRNIGKWIKYDRGSDHMPLVNSLQGYNTGWCTAGESTAKSQLSSGDFYVYYTLDENDEYKVPRIAIRMSGYKIAEIRGVAENQNLEPEMEEVVEEKIKNFPDKEEYYKKVNDMKLLTRIYKKHKNREELAREELRFLYEIDSKIIGFGYGKDPRVEEIINERKNWNKDIAYIFDYHVEQVAILPSEVNKNTTYYYGDLNINEYLSFQNISVPKILNGNFEGSIPTLHKQLVLPQIITGDMNIGVLQTGERVVFPEIIKGSLHIGIINLQKLSFLNLEKILKNSRFRSTKQIVLPKQIGENLALLFLENADGIVFPEIVGGEVRLPKLKSAIGLNLPNIIGGSLYLGGLESAEGLVLPEEIGGSLYLNKLKDIEGLVLPKKIGRDLCLYGISNPKNLIIPDPLTYNICFDSFTITPENVDEYRTHKKI